MAYLIDGVGPTAVRTFTFPDQNATMLTSAAAVTAAQGGTGIASYAVGDLLYASGAATLSKLADVAVGSVLVSGGVATAPAWSASPSLTSVGVGPIPAASGGIRLSNSGGGPGGQVKARNAANSADISLLELFSDNNIYLGASGVAVLPNSDNGQTLGQASQRWSSGFFGTAVAVGANPALTGAIRLQVNSKIVWRNGANSADIDAVQMSADQLILSASNAVQLWVYDGIGATGFGHFYPGADDTIALGYPGLRFATGGFSRSVVNDGFYEGTEMTAPAAPAANKFRIYGEDNGSGKTRVMCLFSSGAAVQIAIQP